MYTYTHHWKLKFVGNIIHSPAEKQNLPKLMPHKL